MSTKPSRSCERSNRFLAIPCAPRSDELVRNPHCAHQHLRLERREKNLQYLQWKGGRRTSLRRRCFSPGSILVRCCCISGVGVEGELSRTSETGQRDPMSSNPLVWRESHRRCGFGHFRADSNRKRTPGSEIGPSHILDLTNFGSTFCKVMGPGVACTRKSNLGNLLVSIRPHHPQRAPAAACRAHRHPHMSFPCSCKTPHAYAPNSATRTRRFGSHLRS